VIAQHTAGQLMLAALLLVGFGCSRTEVARVPPAPSPPPPVKPVEALPGAPPKATQPVIATFSVEPSAIEPGQTARLRWTVLGASGVTILPGVGTVPAQGNLDVSPRAFTRYTLTATGPAGQVSALAIVQMIQAPPPVSRSAPGGSPSYETESLLRQKTGDVFFEYDRAELTDDTRQQLISVAASLREIFEAFAKGRVIIEGHCDERGSAEYNFGLGDWRAASVQAVLLGLGLPPSRLSILSWGKEAPQCSDSTEECWKRNRRAFCRY
jgi:peptidoglycan-associated lipoprotein